MIEKASNTERRVPASILKRLEEGRIFSISRNENTFIFWEECDLNFKMTLTSGELRQLVRELDALWRLDDAHD